MHFFVRRNLKHDGKQYRTGDQVELEDKHATSLLAIGAVSTTQEAPSVEPETVTESTPAEPTIGGKPQESGEPSLDGDQPKKDDNAKDVTPGASKQDGKQDAETDPSANL